MPKTDDIQTAINRASLMHTLDNEVAKALVAAEVHPKLAEVIMNLHHTNKQLDDEVKQLRKSVFSLAQTLVTSVDATANVMEMIADLRRRTNNEDPVEPN